MPRCECSTRSPSNRRKRCLPWVSTAADRPALQTRRPAVERMPRVRGQDLIGHAPLEHGPDPHRRVGNRVALGHYALRVSRRGPCWNPSATSSGPSGESIALSPSTFSRAIRLTTTRAHLLDKRHQRRLDPGIVRAHERLQPTAAALDIQHGLSTGQDHIGARRAHRPPGIPRWGVRAHRPRQRGAVWLRRIDRGQNDRRLVVAGSRPQPLDRSRRERTEPRPRPSTK